MDNGNNIFGMSLTHDHGFPVSPSTLRLYTLLAFIERNDWPELRDMLKRERPPRNANFRLTLLFIIYFWSKVTIWNVNCARARAFIFDTWTGVLVKVSKCLRQKMYRPEGSRTPNLRIHDECSNLLSYQGQTFTVPCFEHWLWQYRYVWSNVTIWNVCARATSFMFDISSRCCCIEGICVIKAKHLWSTC